jgi:uncharacterized protein (DUF1330 family)
MSAYLIVQLDVHDPEEFKRYMAGAPATDEPYGSEILAAGPAERLEGDWFGSRTVLARFNTKEDAHAWFESAPYQEISKHRRAAAVTNMVIVDGID